MKPLQSVGYVSSAMVLTFVLMLSFVAAKKHIDIEMVSIPGGTLSMGCISELECRADEVVREVTVKSFKMSKYEVTFDEYFKFTQATNRMLPEDYGWGRGNRPVFNVSWQDATDYAAWLSEITGKKYRLPTEAEWEYAARAGTKTKYSWGNEFLAGKANCGPSGSSLWAERQTAPVGSFNANPYGLHDMHGNVWEWVQDWYGDYNVSDQMDPKDPDKGKFRVLRGGGWIGSARSCRSAYRGRGEPDDRDYIGFRLAQG